MHPALSASSSLLSCLALAVLLSTLALPVQAADGLQVGPAPRWQARLQLSSLDGNLNLDPQRFGGNRLLSANLLGDYYFTGSGFASVRGGLRATGGMYSGPLSLSQNNAGLALGANARVGGSNLAVGQRNISLFAPGLDGADPSASISYLGLGYSGQMLRSGLSFSADLGVIGGGSSTSGLRLGRSNSQAMDDVLRDMRYKPVLQLGLSYSY